MNVGRMKGCKKCLLISIILLILIGESAGTANFVSIEIHYVMDGGKTLYVGGNGEGNYTHIQDAINDASDGDTIFVYSGTYYENIVINKSINLIGENAKATIIDGMKKGKVIFIITSNISVCNFTIRNGTIGIGNSRWHDNLEKITIENNIIVDNIYEGISLWWSDHCVIYGNTVSNDTWGICLYGSYFNIVINNNLMKNEENAHIYYWSDVYLFWTNRFIRNYWDNWRIPIPKPIVAFFYPIYPLIQFDWMPRLFPYRGGR